MHFTVERKRLVKMIEAVQKKMPGQNRREKTLHLFVGQSSQQSSGSHLDIRHLPCFLRRKAQASAVARPLRIERLGVWYHLTARGNERRAIFRDDADRRHFCGLLGEMAERFRTRLHAFVLMDNHYHLLLSLTEPNLSRGAQWLNVSYSVWFNRRHDRSGHLFQGRFKSIVVNPAEWGLELSRYVHLNPVRIGRLGLGKSARQRSAAGAVSAPQAGVVQERLSRLRAFRWSSYRACIGLESMPSWLDGAAVLDLGGGKARQRQRAYRDYVERAVREGLEKTPWEALRDQVALGGAEFLAKLRPHWKGNATEQGVLRRLAADRPSFADVLARLERAKGEKWSDFRDRRGDSGRDLALYLGRHDCGLKLQELAALAGLRDYKTAATAIKRFEQRLAASAVERQRLEQVRQMSNVEM